MKKVSQTNKNKARESENSEMSDRAKRREKGCKLEKVIKRREMKERNSPFSITHTTKLCHFLHFSESQEGTNDIMMLKK